MEPVASWINTRSLREAKKARVSWTVCSKRERREDVQHARVWFGGEAPHGLWNVGRCPGCVHSLGVKGGVSAAEGRREGVVEWTDKRAIEP